MNNILEMLNDFNKALDLLDDYDHQCLKKPIGQSNYQKLTYEECRQTIDSMKFDSLIFGIEKDESFKSSINAIYQSAFNKDIYPSIEEKAANLLYFITKNHSFIDGNKRIAAAIFLQFLYKNNILYKNQEKIIADDTLVLLVILIAQSKSEEKETMIKLVMNILIK